MDQLRKHIGKGADQYLPEFLSPEDLRTIGKKIEQCHSEVFKEEYLPQVRPFPKVRELFERIKRDGKRIALATSGKKEELRIYKKIAQIEDLTDSEIQRTTLENRSRLRTYLKPRCASLAILQLIRF